jgi:hypothetical protein
VRELDRLNPRVLVGTESASKPFWSPDSQEIAYFHEPDSPGESQLWRARIDGGRPTLITKLPVQFQMNPWTKGRGAWLSDGRIIFTDGDEDNRSGLWEVEARGGDPRLLLKVGEEEEAFQNPSPLPEGRGVLFLVKSKAGKTDKIAVYANGSRKSVFELPGESFAFAIHDPVGISFMTGKPPLRESGPCHFPWNDWKSPMRIHSR